MKLYQIFYREVGETDLGEKIHPFESDEESNWESPEELMCFLSAENNFPHGKISEVSGNYVTFEDGYCIMVGDLK